MTAPRDVRSDAMASRRRRRLLSVVITVAVGASLTGGIAAAVQRSPRPLHACVNAKGDLGVLTAGGHCAKHFSRVTLDRRGATGASGRRGERGRPGPTGPTGHTGAAAESSVASNTSGTANAVNGQVDAVPGTGLRVQALCVPGASSTVRIIGADRYVIHGFSHFTIGDFAVAANDHQSVTGHSTSSSIHVGPRLFGWTNDYPKAKAVSDLRVSVPNAQLGQGEFSANLLAVDDHMTFTIAVYLFVTDEPSRGCRAAAQVTAAS